MPRFRHRSAAEAGFSLIELLVILLLIGLLAVWGYPSFLGTINRLRLTATAREAAVFMQVARMEAAKRSVSTQVIYQNAATSPLGRPSLLAFADLDADGVYTAAGDRILAGPYVLQKGIDLWGPLDGAAEGGNAIELWDETATPNNGPIFSSDGSAQGIGAFRFRDRNGNFLETRIEYAGTGKVVLQKWFGPDDNPDTAWFENGESGNDWSW